MKRGILIAVVCISLAVIALSVAGGILAARGIQGNAYDMGRLTASAEWTRHLEEIERQITEDGSALVGDWRLVLERNDAKAKIAKVKRRSAAVPKKPIGGQ